MHATAPDLAAIARAAQSIAREIELPALFRELAAISMREFGAMRAAYISKAPQGFIIEAEAVNGDPGAGSAGVPLQARLDFSLAAVERACSTAELAVEDDSASDSLSDGSQAGNQASVICAPLISRGAVHGALYLEKPPGESFLRQSAELLQVLLSGAAVSLENARLYDEMKREVERRRQTEETLRAVTEGTASAVGADFFCSLVRHLAEALQVRFAFATELQPDQASARTLAFWNGKEFRQQFEYALKGTPCQGVLGGQVGLYERDLRQLFPDDRDLTELGADSYLGIPMRDSLRQIVGHLAVMDQKPIEDSSISMSILKTFAVRAAAELERARADAQLRNALTEVERLKDRLQAENGYLRDEIRGGQHPHEMVGSSPALRRVLARVEQVAPTDSTVLIYGETGTGKEMIARLLHERGQRHGRPLVKVNCGAISAGLVESELFGHVKGAFTGALERRMGRFEVAHRGTIFLDEIGELPLETQVKLLRVLQEQEFEPVGSSRTVKVDVRVIAATNRDLESAVREGRFREDLYYRLNVFPLNVPPLRQRREDIPALVKFFLARFARKFRRNIVTVSPETMARFEEYHWPGNVRELQNVLERAVILADGPVLAIPPELLPLKPAGASGATELPLKETEPASLPGSGSQSASASESLDDIQRRHILEVLERTNWVIEGPRGAAQILDLHPNTLRSRLQKLGIRRHSATKSRGGSD